jgi:hypothetical protein
MSESPLYFGQSEFVDLTKIFRFTEHANHLYISAIPAQLKGAFRDRHERRARDAVDADGAFDEQR